MSFNKLEKYGIVLNRLTHDKIELLRNWRNDPKIANCMEFRDYITPEMQEIWFRTIDNDRNFYFLVEYDGKEIGIINIRDIDYGQKTGEGGIFIYNDNYKDGVVAVRASLCFYDFCFETLGLNKIIGHILQDNIRSQKFNTAVGYELQPCQEQVLNQLYFLAKDNYLKKRESLIQKKQIQNDKKVEYLAWDTEFFKKKIGRVFVYNIDNLSNILQAAKNDGYQLVYVFGNQDFAVNDKILKQFNGKLVDKKVFFKKNIETAQEPAVFVSEYMSRELTPELEELTYLSGEHSRFKLDENFAKDDFYRMYKVWIENSVKHQMADNVFVVNENNLIKAMLTLKIDHDKGHITLIAVASDTQGKGYGKALIAACENELLGRGIDKLEVPTQIVNEQACRFYEKCGFHIKSINNIYHFWL